MNDFTDVAHVLRTWMDEVQHNRLLRLSFPNNDGPRAVMLANRIDAYESLSRDFRYTVEVLSDNPAIPLKEVQGRMVTIEMVREDGSLRYFNGYVFEFTHVRTDGGYAFYEMVLLPWLAFLRLRRNYCLFHDKSVREQTEIIFTNYHGRDWRTHIHGDDAPLTEACQYDESDYNYLHRRWEARGWHYWYEHRADGHTLILVDDSRLASPIDGGSSDIPFRDATGSHENDGIAVWTPMRRVVSGKVSVSSFDFKNPRLTTAGVSTTNEQGNIPELEVYEYTGLKGFKSWNEGDKLARQRMEEIEAKGKQFEAQGNDRFAMPGQWFRLTGHYGTGLHRGEAEHDEFLVIEAHHSAANNYQIDGQGPACYNNRLTCIRKYIPWRPGRGFNSTEPKIYGLQTAIVVGPKDEEIWTDEYGRARVHFHWDRSERFDERSSAWVRVSASYAGQQEGEIALPRVGQEVIVQYLDGNPDRPLITGRVYNAQNMPPAFSHTGALPDNRYLSGRKTREIGGRRYNQQVFDDTPGQISIQTASEHAYSQFNAGYLTEARDGGKARPRGEGVEMRTDAAASIRAASGLLLTTHGRPAAAASQLSREELIACLDATRELVQVLTDAARQTGADKMDVDPQNKLESAIDHWEQGTNTDPKASGGNGRQPVIAISAAAGMALTTPRSATIYTGENLDIATQNDTQQSTGKRWLANVGTSISWFVAGIADRAKQSTSSVAVKLIAARGRIFVQAQSDSIEQQAERDIILGANARISINARGGITLTEQGGAQIELAGGNVTVKCPGAYTVHASSVSYKGAGGGVPDLPVMPGKQVVARPWLELHYLDPDSGEPIAEAPYEVNYVNGVTMSGVLDAAGKARHDNVPDVPLRDVAYKPRAPEEEQPVRPLSDLL
jgi:type VI secretion system secreted protein VgrG